MDRNILDLLVLFFGCQIQESRLRNVKIREPLAGTDDFSCLYIFWSRRGVASRTDGANYFLATRKTVVAGTGQTLVCSENSRILTRE